MGNGAAQGNLPFAATSSTAQMASPKPRPRSIVYIDGFNLYYGAVKDGPNKWLNIEKYFRMLRQGDDVLKVKYFTAMVTGPTRPNQEIFIKALATLPTVEVILGKYKTKKIKCTVPPCLHAGDRFFERQEEKRSDVSIAIHMLDDAYQDACDVFVIVSGDSDLVPAMHMIKHRCPQKKLALYVPARDKVRAAAVEIRGAADTHRELPIVLLGRCQFPVSLPDGSGGTITKPASW